MNKIYKVVWSKVKHQYVVTSEFAHSRTKSAGRASRSAAVLAALLLTVGTGSIAVQAQVVTPTDSVYVVNGDVIISGSNDAANNTSLTVTGNVSADEVSVMTEDGQTYKVGETLVNLDEAGIVGGTVSENAPGGIAIGEGSAVNGYAGYGLAVGRNSQVNGVYGVAIGDSVSVTGTNSTAIGRSSRTDADSAVALGAYSSATRDNTVSVGRGTGYGKYDITRQITNVADGTEDFDAVNVRQLTEVQENIGEDLGSLDFSDTNYASTATNVTDAIYDVDTQVKENTDVLDGYVNAGIVAGGLNSDDGIALGQGSIAGENSIAIGQMNWVTGDNSVGIGQDASVAGNNSVAIGNNTNVYSTADNSVALGNRSVATRANTVSVGSSGNERQITNVAAGTEDTDAVNVGQLNSAVDVATAGVVKWDKNADGTYNEGDLTVSNLKTDTISAMNGNFNVNENGLTYTTNGSVTSDLAELRVTGNGTSMRYRNNAVMIDEDGTSVLGTLKAGNDAVIVTDDGEFSAGNRKFTVAEDGTLYSQVGRSQLQVRDDLVAMSHSDNAVMIDEDGTFVLGTFKAGNDAVIVTDNGDFSAGNRKFTVDADGNVLAFNGNSSFSVSDGGVGAQYANNVFSVDENGIQLSVRGQSNVEVTATGTTFSAPGTTGVTTISGDTITTGTVTGLTNTTWDGTTTDESRAATEGQLADLQGTVDGIDALAVKYDSETKDSITFEGENGTALKNVSDIEMNGKSFAAAGIEAGTSSADYDVVLGGGSWSEGEYAVALGHEAYVTGYGSMALGAHTRVTGNNSVAIGYGSIADEDNVVSVGSYTTQRRITNVADGVADSDAATVGQLKDAFADAGIDSNKGNVVQYDKDGSLHAGNEGTGSLDLNSDGSASLTGNQGNGFIANADGTNTIEGNTNINGNLTINGDTVATTGDVNVIKTDVNTIKGQIGANEDGSLGLTNGETTLVDGINHNTSSINTIKDQIGGTGEDGSLNLTNGATTIESGINANTAAIEQNSQAINSLGSRVHDLGEEIDSVGAISAALAGLHPLDYDGTGSKFQISAALGTYDGTQAAAIGGFYHFNEDIMMSVGGATSFEGDKKTAANLGVTFRVGEGASGKAHVSDDIMKRLEAMDQKIAALEAENQQLKGVLGAIDMTMSKAFPDVPENHWAYEAVSKLAGNNVVSGYPDGEFHGDRTMTRYEMAEIIYKAMSRGAQVDQKLVDEFRPEMEQVAANQNA